MKKEYSNLLKYFLWFLFLPFFYTVLGIFGMIFYSVELFKSYPLKSISSLALGVAEIVIATVLLITYLKLSSQPLFNKEKKLNHTETIFLVLKCFCIIMLSMFIISEIFYPSRNWISAYISYYRRKNINLSAIFSPHYYYKFYILKVNIIAPVFEEIIFRRVIYDSIKRHSNSIVLAAIISSICFAVIHFNSNQDVIYNANYIVGIFFFGLILVYCYHKTNRIIPCMIIHFMWNARVLLFDNLNRIYSAILDIFLILISLVVSGYIFIRYLLKLYKKRVAVQQVVKLDETCSQVFCAHSSNNFLQILRDKALLPILFLAFMFEIFIVMQTIIIIFKLNVDYKIVWYAGIKFSFFVVFTLYLRERKLSLRDVLIKSEVHIKWGLILKALSAIFVLCFVCFYLPNASRFSAVIDYFKDSGSILDLSIFNFSGINSFEFFAVVFLALIIEALLFKVGASAHIKTRSWIIPVVMFVSYVLFALLYTMRLKLNLTELTVLFCISLVLSFVYEKSGSILTVFVLHLTITVCLFFNKFLFFVYSAPLFFILFFVGLLGLSLWVASMFRIKKCFRKLLEENGN